MTEKSDTSSKTGKVLSYLFNTGALLSGFILVLMMIAIVIEVILRHSPITIADFSGYATVRMIFPIMTFSGLGYTWKKKSHVRVEFLLERFSPNIKNLINLLIYFCIFIVLLFITWGGAKETIHSFRTLQEDMDMAIRLYYFKAVIPIGCIIMSMAVLFDCFQTIKMLRNKS